MKKIFVIILGLILCALFFAKHNNDPKIIISNLVKNEKIRLGGLKYEVYLLGIMPVGEAVLAEKKEVNLNNEQVYYLTATAKSSKLFSKFFSGSATWESYVDKKQLTPLLFKQRIVSPGKERATKEIIYDQRQSIMSMGGIKRQILPNTYDPLSLVFNIMRMDFNNKNNIEMNINTNQKNYILEATVEPRTILVNKKRYNLVMLKGKVKRRDNNPYHKSSFYIVLLKDNQGNIPILIKVFASGFLINAKLIDIR